MSDDWITDYANAQADRFHAAIEEACEKALQMGDRGVFVHWQDDGSLRVGPHPLVPYGKRYEVRGELSDDFWSNVGSSNE